MKGNRGQAGIALAVTLFMLALLTLIGVAAITASTSHLRLVGNLQAANEAEMALRAAIEQSVCEKAGSDCAPVTYDCKSLSVCVNGRGVNVEIRPRCLGAAGGDEQGGSLSARQVVDTYWDFEGTAVGDPLGAGMTVHWGLRVPKAGPCPRPNPYAAGNTPPTCPVPANVTCN